MRLIDADDFLDLFYVMAIGQDKLFIKAVEQVVSDTPTVDAVPVIRCKDCLFCRKYKYREDVCTCLKFGSGRNMYDYCSYAQIKEADFGERRNDDCN